MRPIDADDFMKRMYHEVFEKDSGMQKWDSGCWIRYKLFEKMLKEQPTIKCRISCEEANPDFETCGKCVHSDDSEEVCILRRCIHAVSQLKECYKPKSSQRTGNWIDDDGNVITNWGGYCATCSCCGEWSEYLTDYCPNCGAKMEERRTNESNKR